MNTIEFRNLTEQVQKNKEDILKHFQRDEILADFGIRIIGTLQEAWELDDIPTQGLQYGDAYAVGFKSPYTYYIWTRADATHPTDYWFNFGEIAIAGPAGPQGPKGAQGKDGTSTQWYYIAEGIGDIHPMNYREGDMVLDANGNVYRCEPNGQGWVRVTNIKGPEGTRGVPGRAGATGAQGPQGPKGDKGDPGGFVSIAGILEEEEGLPDPALVDNKSIGYLVGTEYPYDLYIQVGDPVRYWVNTGPLNAASLISVSGQYVNLWNADTKRDRIEGLEPFRDEDDELPAVVYTQDNGVDQWSFYSTEPKTGAFALWTGPSNSPVLKSGTPTEPEHVVNKAYFDGIVNNIGTGHVRTYVFDSLDKSNWSNTVINALYELVDYANDIYFDNYKEVLQTDKIFMLRYTPESNVPEYLLPFNVTIERRLISGWGGYKIQFSYLRKAPTDNLIDIQILLTTSHNYMSVNTYQQDITSTLLDWQYLNANLQIPRRFNIPHMPGSDKVGQYFNGDNADDYLYSELRDMVENIATYEYFEQYEDGAAYEGFKYDFWYYNGNQFTKIKVEEESSESEWRVTLGLLDEGTWKEWTIIVNVDDYTFYLDDYQTYTFQRQA